MAVKTNTAVSTSSCKIMHSHAHEGNSVTKIVKSNIWRGAELFQWLKKV